MAQIYGELIRAQLQLAAADLTPTATGLIYFNTATPSVKWYTGSAWVTAADTSTAQTFTNKTLTAPTIDQALMVESAAPATPASGRLSLFAKADSKLYTLNSAGVESPVGAAGSGEINVIESPSDANDWVASGAGITVATTSTASELPLGPVVDTGIKITPVSGTAYARYRFTMPAALKSKKLKFEWHQKPLTGYASGDIKVEVYKNAASDYSGAYTEFGLSTDNSGDTLIPNSVGKFTSYFDADNADYYEVRFVRVSGTTALVVANVVVGPGIQANSAIVGQLVPWTPISNWVANATWTGNYRQVGQFVEYFVEASFSGATTAAGSCDVSLPVGHVVSSLFKGPSGTLSIITSSGSIFNGSSNVTRLSANVLDASTVRIGYTNTASDQAANLNSTSAPFAVGAGTTLRIEFKLPIVAFEGAGTINVNTPDVEYAYNTNLADANDTTSFGYGSEGTVFGNFTAARNKTVNFRYQPQPSDRIVIEMTTNGGLSWTPYETTGVVSSVVGQNSVLYGLAAEFSGANNYVLLFGDYRTANNTVFGAASSPWSDIDNNPQYKWRVAKYSGPSPVGFSTVTQAQSGLVARAGQLLGTNTSDSAEAGHVGEVIFAFATATPANIGINVVHNYLSITLTAGEWEIKAAGEYIANATITDLFRGIIGISTSNTSFTDVFGLNSFAARSAGGTHIAGGQDAIYAQVTSGTYKVPFGTTQNVYLNSLVNYAGGQMQITGGLLRAIRVR